VNAPLATMPDSDADADADGASGRRDRGDPLATDQPSLQAVLDALDDPDCRAIVRRLERPMTAAELSAACEMPSSTTYRKLELLSDASLVEERIEVRTDGQHTTRYALAFEAVRVALDEDRTFELDIERSSHTPEDQLSELWAAVRRET
jgi:DNA-binding transcriptional ArsR family regulator